MKKTVRVSPEKSARPAESDAATGEAALVWAVNQGQTNALTREVAAEVRRVRRRRLRLVSAACVAAALVLVGLRIAPQPARTPDAAPVIVLWPEVRVLPDGSVAELNRGARISVEFSEHGTGARRVVVEEGEAHFQVAKDSSRPFLVVAGGVTVRAVGTAFAVQLGAGTVDVLVTEGRVSVAATTAASAPAGEPLAFVAAGQRMRVDLGALAVPEPAIAVPDAERVARLAWRAPRVEFSGAPLADVIPVFNRHGPTRLVLTDPALGRLLVSGLLRADNTHALLLLLESEFGLVAESRGAETVLRRR